MSEPESARSEGACATMAAWVLVLGLIGGTAVLSWMAIQSSKNAPPPPKVQTPPQGTAADPLAGLPDDARKAVEEARPLMQKGDVQGALAPLQRAHDAAPDDWRTAAFLGHALNQLGKADEAVPLLGEAHRKKPNDTGVAVELGIALVGCGRYDEARAPLERAAKMSPKDAAPHFFLGVAALRTGDAKLAAAELQACLERNPRNPDVALRLLAMSADAIGDDGLAIAALGSFVAIRPGDVGAQREWQQRREARGQRDELIAEREKALKEKPDDANEIYLLARLLSEDPDQRPRARKLLERACELEPDWPWPALGLAHEDMADLRFEEAAKRLDRAIEKSPGFIEGRLLRAEVDRARGDAGAARAEFEKLARDRESGGAPLGERGLIQVLRDLGKLDEALEKTRASLTHAPAGAPERELEATVLAEAGRFSEAEAVVAAIGSAARNDAARSPWIARAAVIALEAGDVESARGRFAAARKALGAGRAPPDLLLWQGVALARAGDVASARAAWELGAKTGERWGDEAVLTGACERLLGKIEKEELLRRAAVATDLALNDALFVDGLARELAGDQAGARASYEAALRATKGKELPARQIERALAAPSKHP